MAINTMCGLCTWYNDSAFAEFKPAWAGLPSLRDALYPAIHGLKIKCLLRSRLIFRAHGIMKKVRLVLKIVSSENSCKAVCQIVIWSINNRF